MLSVYSLYFPRGSNLTYKYIVSEPLGRSSYKERYLFLYRYENVLLSIVIQVRVLYSKYNQKRIEEVLKLYSQNHGVKKTLGRV